jgi:DNA-directed RNA polymerase specialized sigma24 family protein
MGEIDRCPTCGSVRPASSPGGLCPFCLLRIGLSGEDFDRDDVGLRPGPGEALEDAGRPADDPVTPVEGSRPAPDVPGRAPGDGAVRDSSCRTRSTFREEIRGRVTVSNGSVAALIRRLQGGDRSAAQSLWDLYYGRLTRFASRRLHGTPRGVADEEDVALSVLDEFFRLVERQRGVEVNGQEDLWRLLVVIATRRVRNLLRDQGCRKRGGGHLLPGPGLPAADRPAPAELDGFPSRELPPDAIVLWAEECRRLFAMLEDERLQAVASMRLEGYADGEIAVKLSCTRRSVQRRLQAVRETWEGELSRR